MPVITDENTEDISGMVIAREPGSCTAAIRLKQIRRTLMKGIIRHLLFFLMACTAVSLLSGGAPVVLAQGEPVTLVGEINDTFQLVANGLIYDIAETAEGDDLVRNYVSVKVKVIGTLQKGEEIDIVTVRSFEVVDE
jgi:hypothetical protein